MNGWPCCYRYSQHRPDPGGYRLGHAVVPATDAQGNTMSLPIADTWVYLSTSPLLGLTITLLAYQAGLQTLSAQRCPPAGQPGLDRHRHSCPVIDVDRNKLRNLLRRRPVRSLPARPGHGCPGGAALHAVQGAGCRSMACRLSPGCWRQRHSDCFGSASPGCSMPVQVTQASLAPKSVTTPIAMGLPSGSAACHR
jgi:hypothetical protein